MKHKLRKAAAALLAAATLCAGLPVISVSAAESETTIVNSGTVDGTSISWEIDSEGVMTVNGSGTLPQYAFEEGVFKEVTKIVFAKTCAISGLERQCFKASSGNGG